MLFSDDRQDALEASNEFTDARVRYFWDPEKSTGEAFGNRLQIDQTAWDVYLVFDSGVKWQEPLLPSFWMHQLTGLEHRAPMLNTARLEAVVDSFLSTY